MKYKDETRSLMAKTLELLKESDKTPLDIYTDTGLQFYWLKQFSHGKIKNPSVNRIQFLFEYLTGKKLEL